MARGDDIFDFAARANALQELRKFTLLLQFLEELLSVRSRLRARPRPHMLADHVPVLAVEFKAFDEFVVFVVSPLPFIHTVSVRAACVTLFVFFILVSSILLLMVILIRQLVVHRLVLSGLARHRPTGTQARLGRVPICQVYLDLRSCRVGCVC